MRPLNNIKPEVAQFKYPIDALLMMSIGECCTMCERPLLADSMVWDRKQLKLVNGRIKDTHWEDMLLLCHNCGEEIKISSKKNTNLSTLIYPDKNITFNLKKSSLFYYSLEKIRSFTVNNKHQPIGDGMEEEVALIKGTTDAANRTIDLFKLNSHYYNKEQHALFIPEFEDLKNIDRRLILRTRAWMQAAEFLNLFEKSNNNNTFSALTVNLKNCVSHSGFWSVWVTLFSEKFHNKKILKKLFAQNCENVCNEATKLTADASYPLGQGPHNHFPGLNNSWLD